MSVEIKVPAVGESITEATIGSWLKKSGDAVRRDEVLLVLETDKASVEVVAETDGVLTITAQQGQTVAIGSTVGSIAPGAAPAKAAEAPKAEAPAKSAPAPAAAVSQSPPKADTRPEVQSTGGSSHAMNLSPAVRRVVEEKGIDPSGVTGTGRGGRLTKGDVLGAEASPSPAVPKSTPAPAGKEAPARPTAPTGAIERVPMTTIRKRIAERLVQAQQTAAILTTFNEVDMTAVMDLRNKYKDSFEKKHGVKLGFMGFFVKACIQALREFPAVNASIEGTDILYKHFANIGIAVSTPKGLVVPVLKNADQMSLAEIESAIAAFGVKAKDGKLTVDDMMDGTFTISNGGVFGSLMSTPILNPPQSAILGMHKIEKRPIAVNDEVVIRPMMYVALSYDHRMIDGRESVSFLVRVKECLEDPARLVMEI